MATPVGTVKHRLAAIDFSMHRVKIVPGFIEETVNQGCLPERVSFAYVDLDFYEPIKIALDFLDRVTHSGAIIIVDDYDYFSAGAKTAVEEFLAEVGGYEKEFPVSVAGRFVVLHKR